MLKKISSDGCTKIRMCFKLIYLVSKNCVILIDFTRNTQEHSLEKYLLYVDLLLYSYPVTQYLCRYGTFLWTLLILSIQFT